MVSSQTVDFITFATRACSRAPLCVIRYGTNLARSGSFESLCLYFASFFVILAATFQHKLVRFSWKSVNVIVYTSQIPRGFFVGAVGIVHDSRLKPEARYEWYEDMNGMKV